MRHAWHLCLSPRWPVSLSTASLRHFSQEALDFIAVWQLFAEASVPRRREGLEEINRCVVHRATEVAGFAKRLCTAAAQRRDERERRLRRKARQAERKTKVHMLSAGGGAACCR